MKTMLSTDTEKLPSIPLQFVSNPQPTTLLTPTHLMNKAISNKTSTDTISEPTYFHPPSIDIVTVSKRSKGDICHYLFGTTLDHSVDHILVFAITNKQILLNLQAFVHQNTIFMMFPDQPSDDDGGMLTWPSTQFQSCFTSLIEILEEKTGCQYFTIAINKNQNAVDTVLRAFYYIGFQIVKPSVYGQSADYILVGYEL
ncbi:uncharacterized protein BX664DRAFT_334301 [Halteromyces radiatus]|uniref:uncharacterized protein n=1 Tax=Halteromyces radiatus TaxID=101107 RepID=UPI00221F10AE|nr:uncharacterized protein BX664DRAFT_334301 [Halteromyces radiatus]KAI8089952.1 hypothetical protein BX664DRAFT_334301 [Halteromyces radiatus]